MRGGTSDIRSAAVLTCCFLLGVVTASFAADLSREEAQAILSESILALLTGKEFGPALEQRQQALRERLETGDIKKVDLTNIRKRTILPVLNQHKTSRYILKAVPEKFDKLLAPYMKWREQIQAYDERCLKAFEIKCGIKPVPLSQEDQQVFSQAAKNVHKKLACKVFSESLLNEILRTLEKYRAAH